MRCLYTRDVCALTIYLQSTVVTEEITRISVKTCIFINHVLFLSAIHCQHNRMYIYTCVYLNKIAPT